MHRTRSLSWPFVALFLPHTLGCVTPPEIKTAARAQLELIDALDDATADLKKGLDRFHSAKLAKTRQEGRMLIARQAIDVAVGDIKKPGKASADLLFLRFGQSVGPWIDYAFLEDTTDKAIAKLGREISKIDEKLVIDASGDKKDLIILKARKEMDRDDLTLFASKLKEKPIAVQEIEAVISEDISSEQATQKEVNQILDILRAQIALMRAMAIQVDSWLAIDVTVDQEQVDALAAAYRSAQAGLGGGGS